MEHIRRLHQSLARNRTSSARPEVDTPDAQAPTAVAARGVQVIYGASVQTLALVGLTLAQARPLVETILAVAPRSRVLVNGRQVRDTHVIAEGDGLEYVHHAGEKGRWEWTCESKLSASRLFASRTVPKHSPLH
jgi:hypothetical protein